MERIQLNPATVDVLYLTVYILQVLMQKLKKSDTNNI